MFHLRRTAIVLGLAIAAAMPGSALAQQYDGPLYSGPAVGSEGWRFPRTVIEQGPARSVYNTREPMIRVHLPPADRANGAAVVLLPGGGLRVLGMGRGTDAEVQAFLDHGVAVAVLEYRTMQVDPAGLARPATGAGATPPPPVRFAKMVIRNANANPAPDNAALAEVQRLAVEDGREALRLLHRRAADWRLDPARIGMIGTSAGGGVMIGALLAGGEAEALPDFLISIFGPALQDVVPPADAPPLFIATEADHGPVTDGLLALFSLWKDNGHKAELHIYEVPNFTMTVDLWGPRLFSWMAERGIVPAPAAATSP